MSKRSDIEYAKQFELDKEWYTNFIKELKIKCEENRKKKPPTNRQLYTIKQIEERSGIKFVGNTVLEASEFIDTYGLAKYNRSSDNKYFYG